MQVISDLSAVGAMDYLPEQAFEQGEDVKFSPGKGRSCDPGMVYRGVTLPRHGEILHID